MSEHAVLPGKQDLKWHYTHPRRVMARMMGGTRLPPIPYLLSNMVTKKAPRKPPDDERDIKRDDELKDLPPEVRREEVRAF